MTDETETAGDGATGDEGLLGRIYGLPLPRRLAIATIILGVGGLSLYRTHDYVRHDNQFCMSRHLIGQPTERFARGTHGGLSCESFHQPTLVERSTRTLAQLVQQLYSVTVHTAVPNQRCAECSEPRRPPEGVASADDRRIREVARLASTDRSVGALATMGVLAAVQARDTLPRFRHRDHVSVDCQVCHNIGEPTSPSNTRFCRSCHHRRASATGCVACHSPEERARQQFGVRRSLDLSVGSSMERTLLFPHASHEDLGCGRCHTNPPSLSAEGVECAACHEDHHGGEAVCSGCHLAPPDSAHPLSAHVTCTGSGCHESIPFAEPPRSRPVCETCHRPMTEHRVGQECVSCHVLPTHPLETGRPR